MKRFGSFVFDVSTSPSKAYFSTTYTGPILMVTPRGSLGRWRLAYKRLVRVSLNGFYPDCHPSQLTTYTGPTLAATPRGFPERWRLAHKRQLGASLHEFYLDDHLSQSTAYMDSTLTAIRRGVS